MLENWLVCTYRTRCFESEGIFALNLIGETIKTHTRCHSKSDYIQIFQVTGELAQENTRMRKRLGCQIKLFYFVPSNSRLGKCFNIIISFHDNSIATTDGIKVNVSSQTEVLLWCRQSTCHKSIRHTSSCWLSRQESNHSAYYFSTHRVSFIDGFTWTISPWPIPLTIPCVIFAGSFSHGQWPYNPIVNRT